MTLYQDCSSHLDSSKNMAARGRGLFYLYIYIEKFKNLLARNHRPDFKIILQKSSFGDHLPRLFNPFGFVKKQGRQEAGLFFPIYLYRKLKKKSCQKPLARFPYNLIEMFLWLSSTKIVQAIWIRQKTWPPRAWGSLFSLYIYMENLKNLLVRNHWIDFIIYFAKNMVPGKAGLFSLYIYIENLKNLIVRNNLTDFIIILQKCFFDDSLPRLFKPSGFVKKTWSPGGWGLFSLYIYIENLKNLLVRNH